MAETFRIGLTGLNAATSDLSVTANNIANANTTGFKYSRAEFSDIFSNSALGQATRRTVGSGVQLAAVTQQFKQGNINATGNPLDIAIDGEGFFKIQAENGTISYTRAGTFGVDSDGYVVTSTGSKLQGFPADVDGNIVVGAAQSMLLQTADIQPRQTSDVEFGINLDAAADAIDSSITPFDPTDPKTYNYTTSATIYDSLGGSHTLSTYFVKNPLSGTSGNTQSDWTVYGTLDGVYQVPTDPAQPVSASNPLIPAINFDPTAASPSGSMNLTFDDHGLLDQSVVSQLTARDISIQVQAVEGVLGKPTSATEPLQLSLDFLTATQFGGQSSTNNLVQDGYASGTLVGVNVSDSGIMFGRYTNGQSKVLGQVALFNFRNVQGLSPVGDTAWAETSSSGQAISGPPGSARLGMIRGGALEGSNVEMSDQLVNMIQAQRNFQANAQVIQTADQLTQTLLQIR
ncbi:MAG TPA: flagellar hook protein FlgE [Plasticicumulans sp.]|nr:flagellar hook protein FlgE [Plasticicumulans sp.]